MTSPDQTIDRFGMMDLLAVAGRDVAEGRRLGEAVTLPSRAYSEVVICGMGGSAIAGDLVAASIEGRAGASLRVRTSRGYALTVPPTADALVVLSDLAATVAQRLHLQRCR